MAFMYCPKCNGVQEVKSTGTSKQTNKEKRVYFKRVRTCQTCNTTFTTIEVHEGQMQELEQLRSLVKQIYVSTKQVQPLYGRLKLKSST